MALGDFDNDGAVDVLVAVNNGAPVLLQKQRRAPESLAGPQSDRQEIQSRRHRRKNHLAGRRPEAHRTKVGGGSYLSAHDPRVVLGLGKREKIDWLEVKWPMPGGTTERFTNVPVDRYVTIVEGQGKIQG